MEVKDWGDGDLGRARQGGQSHCIQKIITNQIKLRPYVFKTKEHRRFHTWYPATKVRRSSVCQLGRQQSRTVSESWVLSDYVGFSMPSKNEKWKMMNKCVVKDHKVTVILLKKKRCVCKEWIRVIDHACKLAVTNVSTETVSTQSSGSITISRWTTVQDSILGPKWLSWVLYPRKKERIKRETAVVARNFSHWVLLARRFILKLGENVYCEINTSIRSWVLVVPRWLETKYGVCGALPRAPCINSTTRAQ